MGLNEFTRTNIKIKQATYEKLSEEKGENETWDGFLERLLENTQKEADVGIKQEMREVMTEFGFEAVDTVQTDESLDGVDVDEVEELLEKMQDSE